MATLKIEICIDNAAFGEDGSGEEGQEIARILRQLATKVENYALDDLGPLRDGNGNTVGFAKL